MNSEEMKEQAQYIWNRLDDLAETNPDAYKKFIEDQMKEREVFNSNPEPKMCVLMKTSEKEKYGDLFVNICGWKRIPYPKTDSEPLQLFPGKKHLHKKASEEACTCLPVAANDKVLDEIMKTSFDKLEFIQLVQQFVSQQFKIALESDFEICKEIFTGVFPADPRRLFLNNADDEITEADVKKLLKKENGKLSSPEDLLKKLSCHDVDSSLKANLVSDASKNSKKPLVEEVKPSVEIPDYDLIDDEQANVVLKCRLPLIQSAADCDLNITSSVVELIVGSIYKLQVSLPHKINEDEARAKFIKKTSTLLLTMPKIT